MGEFLRALVTAMVLGLSLWWSYVVGESDCQRALHGDGSLEFCESDGEP